jgi:hypothetical protein
MNTLTALDFNLEHNLSTKSEFKDEQNNKMELEHNTSRFSISHPLIFKNNILWYNKLSLKYNDFSIENETWNEEVKDSYLSYEIITNLRKEVNKKWALTLNLKYELKDNENHDLKTSNLIYGGYNFTNWKINFGGIVMTDSDDFSAYPVIFAIYNQNKHNLIINPISKIQYTYKISDKTKVGVRTEFDENTFSYEEDGEDFSLKYTDSITTLFIKKKFGKKFDINAGIGIIAGMRDIKLEKDDHKIFDDNPNIGTRFNLSLGYKI